VQNQESKVKGERISSDIVTGSENVRRKNVRTPKFLFMYMMSTLL